MKMIKKQLTKEIASNPTAIAAIGGMLAGGLIMHLVNREKREPSYKQCWFNIFYAFLDANEIDRKEFMIDVLQLKPNNSQVNIIGALPIDLWHMLERWDLHNEWKPIVEIFNRITKLPADKVLIPVKKDK